MRKTITLIIMALTASLIVIGCSAKDRFAKGEVLLTEDFSNIKAWERYVSSDGVSHLEVIDGAYYFETDDSGYIWGLNQQPHTDVVIEVTSNQLTDYENNAYGVMCRADVSNNGDGYYFLISGDGYYAIAKGEGDNVNPLVDWDSSSAINKGASTNKIRAVCLGDELQLYVNDKFVAAANDSTYTNGYAGFAGTAFDGGTIAVTFDDLTIWQALPPVEE